MATCKISALYLPNSKFSIFLFFFVKISYYCQNGANPLLWNLETRPIPWYRPYDTDLLCQIWALLDHLLGCKFGKPFYECLDSSSSTLHKCLKWKNSKMRKSTKSGFEWKFQKIIKIPNGIVLTQISVRMSLIPIYLRFWKEKYISNILNPQNLGIS